MSAGSCSQSLDAAKGARDSDVRSTSMAPPGGASGALTILAVLNARLALLRIVETTVLLQRDLLRDLLLRIAARLAAANRRNCSASMRRRVESCSANKQSHDEPRTVLR